MNIVLGAFLLVWQAGDPSVTELTVTGTYQDPSGLMAFPAEVEGWRRGRVLRYDVTPGGVSIAYEFVPRGSPPTAFATAYVYPRTGVLSLESHMSETVEQLLETLPGAAVISDEQASFGRGAEVLEGRMATILQRAQGRPGPMVHYVVLSTQGGWWIKWRLTHAAADESVPTAADRLLGSLLPRQVQSRR